MSTQTIRQSTILIASGKRTKVYSSLDQVPLQLKHRLMASTSGSNSATILLADRAGREEIVRALRGMPNHIQARLTSPKLPWTEAIARKHAAMPTQPAAQRRSALRGGVPSLVGPEGPWEKLEAVAVDAATWARAHWAGLLLPVAVAVGLWALLVS